MPRPLSDFMPRERLAGVPHTTRRFACRSALALAPDGHRLAVVSDQGGGTYEAWTLSPTGGKPERAASIEEHAVRSLCWSPSGELLVAADKGGTELHQLYIRQPDGPQLPVSVDPAGKVQRLLSWNAASPDGTQVAFSSNARQSTDMDIVVADLRTRQERPLLTGAAWHVVGGWSPDGKSLLVMRVLDNTTQDLLLVDPKSGVVTLVRLPVSPAAIWIGPTGRLYAALPGSGQVAIVEMRAPRRRPVLVHVGGRPVAVAGAGRDVFVADPSGRITKIDASTGARGRSARVLARGVTPPSRSVLRRLSARTTGESTILVLALRGGRLDRTGLVVRDGAIADGRATLELWQGGIGSAIRARALGDLAVRVSRETGRLVVQLTAPAGTFTGLRARLVANGVAVDLQRPTSPPPLAPPPTGPSVSSGSGGSTHPPPPPPAPPHQTTTGQTCCNVG